ncbi:MarR family transcriptional regulator [Nocardioides islandensis]|uniref:MarR family transcriptional regulator n=1 Tax=Nocardioides islandensis TaxID=433663 RepID=A0A930YJS1_9ACTN|nr:MarR family transcriptional regulator [Nocardioides islandensis]MBF4765314.1 MarR family transcriptional regulator [Nocardioides islandensis]
MTTDVPQEASTSTTAALDALIQVAATVEPAVARRAGLSTSELQALRHLLSGSRGPVELSHLLGVTSAASSGVVDRLAARGHVRRRPHPDDGRRTRVEVTDSGRREVEELMRPVVARLADTDDRLSDEERAVVRGYLERVTEALREAL